MADTIDSEEYEEEVEGGVIGGGEVSIISGVPPHGLVSVSSHDSFSSVGSSSKKIYYYFPLYLPEHAMFKSISRRRWAGSKNSLIHSRKIIAMRSG